MNRMFTLLIAEDDDGNFLLTKKSLKRWGITNPIIRFTEGQSLLQFLKTALPDCDNTPKLNYLLLLDLYMPCTDGFEVLQQIKQSPRLKHITIAVLTTMDDPLTIDRCRTLGADAYFTKPLKQSEITAFLDKFCPQLELEKQLLSSKIQIKTIEPKQQKTSTSTIKSLPPENISR